ncbi:uncharacterized protein LOC141901958 isoform X2 [Tubulanus polymorphus]|uniref:uncharacterized protein LOC141901958 isoform X2 n=1 Tax=Tubulanus polymorphus TaxID=672921 RepID=UPI003DA6B4EA
MPAFPLFELSRIITFNTKNRGGALSEDGKYCVLLSAFSEYGESSQLALSMSNNVLVFRNSPNHSQVPAIRYLPWMNKPIVAMCFNIQGKWLLCTSKKAILYILPFQAIMDPKARVEPIWRLNDATIIEIEDKIGSVTAITWWHTLEADEISIIGTKKGELVFVNLLTGKTMKKVSVHGVIQHIQVVIDDTHSLSYALITGRGGKQWRLLLEKKDQEHVWQLDSELETLGFDQITSNSLPNWNIIAEKTPPVNPTPLSSADKDESQIQPLKFYQFPVSVQLKPQYSRGRHFISAFDKSRGTFQVYDSTVEHLPLFVYKIPVNADNLILSDRLIFYSKWKDGIELNFISNQMAETCAEQSVGFNADSTVQVFRIPDRVLVDVYKRSFPFYWHRRNQREYSNKIQPFAEEMKLGNYTVLDGCLIVTQTAVYECRPRVAPEHLFLDICMGGDLKRAELLGIMIGLDINELFVKAAELNLSTGSVQTAVRLFQMSKCPHGHRVACLARHGHIKEVMTYLQHILQGIKQDSSTAEMKFLSDMALYCYIYLLNTDDSDSYSLYKHFREFLMNNFCYDEEMALELLFQHGMVNELFELAKSRGLIGEVLETFFRQGYLVLSSDRIQSLLNRGSSMSMIKIGGGSFVRCMDVKNNLLFLMNQPLTAAELIVPLFHQLSSMSESNLIQLANLFDPSKPLLQMYLQRLKDVKNIPRSSSESSLLSVSSMASLAETLTDETEEETNSLVEKTNNMIQFFIRIVLVLARKKGSCSLSSVIPSVAVHRKKSISECDSMSTEGGHQYTIHTQPIACGYSHSALITNGDLFMWGCTDNGRLGHGNITQRYSWHPPCRVETLHMMGIKVLSVSCGNQHTLALTQQGLYGWGDSTYGQVGVGNYKTYTRPMLLETVSNQPITRIQCGQYHNIILTSKHRVYTWGWNVHGQLGHGTVINCNKPTAIVTKDLPIISVAAGYAHSVILTEQGTVYGFGLNMFGELGMGRFNKQTTPRLIDGIKFPVSFISTQYFTTYALCSDGRTLYTWGCSPLWLRHYMHAMKIASNGKPVLRNQEDYLYPKILDTSKIEGKIIKLGLSEEMIPIEKTPAMTLVTSPMRLTLIPSSTPNTSGRTVRHNSTTQAWVNGSETNKDEPLVGNLPDLTTLRYSTQVIPILVESLPNFIVWEKVVSICNQEKQWGVTAEIYNNQKLYIQGLFYSMLEIANNWVGFIEQSKLLETAAEVIKTGLNNMLNSCEIIVENHSELKQCLQQMVKFWLQEDLDFCKLEELLNPFIQTLAVPLSLVLFSGQEELGDEICRLFSVKFCLSVSTRVVADIREGNVSECTLNVTGVDDVGSAAVNDTRQKTEQLTDRLRDEINNHLEEGRNKRHHIALTNNEINALNHSDNSEGAGVFAFTCGHYFTREQFHEKILPDFSEGFFGDLARVKKTAEVMLKIYKSDKKFYPLACPRCVLRFLATEK